MTRDRVIVALDVATADEAWALVDLLRDDVGLFKVGSQLFTATGPDLVRGIVDRGGRVFLDLKYHDIPNTVRSAVESAVKLGVSLVDVHGLGGEAMVRAAAAAVAGSGTRLLAITVLTSHDEGTLAQIGVAGPIVTRVTSLAALARSAGAHGVVASPHEIRAIRAANGPGFLIVTPGIRPSGADANDQSRLATPRAAIEAGADYLVVGRPITQASDPRGAARAIVEDLA